MPVLNYHKVEKDMPDMSAEQKCDTCGGVQIGNQMYYSYPSKNKIEVICRSCFVSQTRRPTKRAPDAGDSAASQEVPPQSGESTPEVNPAATQRR